MLKKILIGVAILIVLLVAAFAWLNNRNRTLSPPGDAKLTSGDLTISITYSRPSVRNRLIFGTEEQGALQPYGKYWRLGANEATEITFNRDVQFNGQPVKAGTYSMYAVPGPDTFDLALNSETGRWGAMEPDYDQDLVHTNVPVQKTNAPVEQYTISLEPIDKGISVIFEWSDTRLVVPVE